MVARSWRLYRVYWQYKLCIAGRVFPLILTKLMLRLHWWLSAALVAVLSVQLCSMRLLQQVVSGKWLHRLWSVLRRALSSPMRQVVIMENCPKFTSNAGGQGNGRLYIGYITLSPRRSIHFPVSTNRRMRSFFTKSLQVHDYFARSHGSTVRILNRSIYITTIRIWPATCFVLIALLNILNLGVIFFSTSID